MKIVGENLLSMCYNEENDKQTGEELGRKSQVNISHNNKLIKVFNDSKYMRDNYKQCMEYIEEHYKDREPFCTQVNEKTGWVYVNWSLPKEK